MVDSLVGQEFACPGLSLVPRAETDDNITLRIAEMEERWQEAGSLSDLVTEQCQRGLLTSSY